MLATEHSMRTHRYRRHSCQDQSAESDVDRKGMLQHTSPEVDECLLRELPIFWLGKCDGIFQSCIFWLIANILHFIEL